MNKRSRKPIRPRAKDAAGGIVEDKAAEARERVGRIEKEASGSAAEAQRAAQAIEERLAEREVAEAGESVDSTVFKTTTKAKKSGQDRDSAREATAYGRQRVAADDDQNELTRGHYGAEAGLDKE